MSDDEKSSEVGTLKSYGLLSLFCTTQGSQLSTGSLAPDFSQIFERANMQIENQNQTNELFCLAPAIRFVISRIPSDSETGPFVGHGVVVNTITTTTP